MDTTIKTATKVITNTKLAIATAFLGAAALAAAGLSGPIGGKPDLSSITGLVFTKFEDIPSPLSPPYFGNAFDTFTITYKNTGKQMTRVPFTI